MLPPTVEDERPTFPEEPQQEAHVGVPVVADVEVVVATPPPPPVAVIEEAKGDSDVESCEEQQIEDKKRLFHSLTKRSWLLLAVSVLVLAGVVTVAVVITTSRNDAPSVTTDNNGKAVDGDTKERYNRFRAAVGNFTDPTKFSSPDTPQSRALQWLVYRDQTLPTYDINEDDKNNMGWIDRLYQRYAVMVLYYACSGEDWLALITPWDELTDVGECEYFGMSCLDGSQDDNSNDEDEVNGVLVKIDLSYQRLAGTLPDELALLTSLTSMVLSENFLEAEIPEVVLRSLTDLSTFAFVRYLVRLHRCIRSSA